MVEIVAGAYQGCYVRAKPLVLRTDAQPANVRSKRIVFVGLENFRAPLHDQLPSTEGDAALPRQFQIELRPFVISSSQECQRDRS